jgi:hypothetical protein
MKMAGYLRSTNPTGMNRRVRQALAELDRYEHTDAYKAYRAKGYSIREALAACTRDAERSA